MADSDDNITQFDDITEFDPKTPPSDGDEDVHFTEDTSTSSSSSSASDDGYGTLICDMCGSKWLVAETVDEENTYMMCYACMFDVGSSAGLANIRLGRPRGQEEGGGGVGGVKEVGRGSGGREEQG